MIDETHNDEQMIDVSADAPAEKPVREPHPLTKRDARGLFLKGSRTHTKGRPKGKHNPTTLNFIRLKEEASKHGPRVYELLKEKIEAGEPWAFQIYYRYLYSVPKYYNEKHVVIPSCDRSVDGQLRRLLDTLPDFDEITQEELMDRVRLLFVAKTQGALEQLNAYVPVSKEDLQLKVDMIKLLVEQAKVSEKAKAIIEKEEDDDEGV